MKLLRYGPMGEEKPGILDADGTIRDLSSVIADLNGAALSPAALKLLAALDTLGRCPPWLHATLRRPRR
jgi:hypothetical protein